MNIILILGSSSPFRARLLREADIPFTVLFPDIDEKSLGDRSGPASELVVAIAKAKAEAILRHRLPEALLVTCDQVTVSAQGEILEKPRDANQARLWLKSYANEHPHTITSVVVTHTITRAQRAGYDVAHMYYNPIPDEAIERAIARGSIMFSGGATDLKDPDLAPYLRELHGDRSTEQGLPMTLLRRLCHELGHEV